MDTREELNERAEAHVKKMLEEIDRMKSLLLLVGMEVHIAPDKTGFTIAAGKDEMARTMRRLALREAADAFSFNMEFSMVGDATKSPARGIAMALFLQGSMMMILNAVKDAREAHASIDEIMGRISSDEKEN